VSHLHGRARLAEWGVQSKIERHVHSTSEPLLRYHGAADRDPAPEFVYNTQNTYKFAAGKDKVGRIDAISVETGRTLWSWETRVSNYSPILATGSGLLFNGGMDRYLRELDSDRGQVLWQTRLASQAMGYTVTYSIGERQYIAIAAGVDSMRGPCE